MSVVQRVIEGVEYYHVQRMVNGRQNEKLINIDGMPADERLDAKDKAEQIDKAFRLEQSFDDPTIANFTANCPGLLEIELTQLVIGPPNGKSDWRVQYPAKSCSRSIAQYGLNEAIKSCFALLAYQLGIKSKTSVTYQVLELLYLKKLRRDYFNQYKASTSTLTSQKQHNTTIHDAA